MDGEISRGGQLLGLSMGEGDGTLESVEGHRIQFAC
jgi:hypothetical protein